MELLGVKNLYKSFNGSVAVDGISFKVEQGEVFGLLGPNGAGKSTTISIIAGLIKPTSGEVHLKNKDITQSMMGIKKVLGLVPQDIALYPTLSAKENLKFWGKMYGLRGKLLKERVEEALFIAGLTNRGDERIETYSGGMKRRINIAAALLHHPQLLIMDEPTVGIDPQSRNYILDTVSRLNQEGTTVIYTSHYMEEVEHLCNRIAIMDNGKIIAHGSKEELKRLVDDADRIDISIDNISNETIERIRGIKGIREVTDNQDSINILVREGREKLTGILSLIVDSGARVKTVNIHEPNLESVFLHLTGRALRD